MTQLSILDALDVCASRHGGAETSVAAHERMKHTKADTHNRIMKLAQARKEYGITVKEVAGAFGVQVNTISGRLSELKQRGKLKDSGQRRLGAAVLVMV